MMCADVVLSQCPLYDDICHSIVKSFAMACLLSAVTPISVMIDVKLNLSTIMFFVSCFQPRYFCWANLREIQFVDDNNPVSIGLVEL